jgi:hypothetical protein
LSAVIWSRAFQLKRGEVSLMDNFPGFVTCDPAPSKRAGTAHRESRMEQ